MFFVTHPPSKLIVNQILPVFSFLMAHLESDMEGVFPSHAEPYDVTAFYFSILISSLGAYHDQPSISKFVKKIAKIPKINFPTIIPCRASLSLGYHCLVGHFTGIQTPPKIVQKWVERNWAAKTQGQIPICFCGREYFTFYFESKEGDDLIFIIFHLYTPSHFKDKEMCWESLADQLETEEN